MQMLKFVLLLLPLSSIVYGAEDTEKYSFDTKDGAPTDTKEEHFLPQSTERKYTSEIQGQNDVHDYKLSDNEYSSDVNSENIEYQFKYPDAEYNYDTNSQNEQYSFPDSKYALQLKDQNGELENKFSDTKSLNGDSKYNIDIKSQQGGYKSTEQDLIQGTEIYQPIIKNQFAIPKLQSIQLKHKYPEYYLTPEMTYKQYMYPKKQRVPIPSTYIPKYYTKYPKYPKAFYSTLPYGAKLRTPKEYANSFAKPFYGYKFSNDLGSRLIGYGSGNHGMDFGLNRFQFTKPVVKYTNSLQFNEFNPAGPNIGYKFMISNLKSPSLKSSRIPHKTGQPFNNNEHAGVGSGSSSVVSGSSDSGYSSPVSAGYTFGTTGQSQISPKPGAISTVEYTSPSAKYSFNTHKKSPVVNQDKVTLSVPTGYKYSSHASPLSAGYSFYKHKEYPVVKETGYTSSSEPGYKYSSHGHSPLITEYGTSSNGGHPSVPLREYKFNINGHTHSPLISTRVAKYSTPVSSEYKTDGGFRPSPSFGYPSSSNFEYKINTPNNHFMPISTETIPENKYGLPGFSDDDKERYLYEIPKQYESHLHTHGAHTSNGHKQIIMTEYKPDTYNIVSGRTKVYDSNLYDVINMMKSGKFSRRSSNEDNAIYVLDKSSMANFPELDGFPKFVYSGNSMIYRYK